jgi:hypothetical protein
MRQLLLSGIGYLPTPNVHSGVWNCVESYTIYMLLACRLKITFTFSLKLIISFLVQLQHLLLPSLIVTSSQVESTRLFLFDRAVSLAWGQKANGKSMPTFKMALPSEPSRTFLESARKQLLHVHARWPEAVHFASWPYALRNAAYGHNNPLVLEDGTSRLELFSSIRVGSNLKHVHTFGCPVFALQNMLASGSQLPRWSPHARLGLNLGLSLHARNVYLVLNLVNRVCLTTAPLSFQQFL